MELQRQLIVTLAENNAKLYEHVGMLERRLFSLERSNKRGARTPSFSSSSEGSIGNPLDGGEMSASFLEPGTTPDATQADLYMGDGSFEALSPPKTPQKRSKEKKVKTPRSRTKGPSTMLNKRKPHTLSLTLPPTFTIVPAIPLTDKELVVFFFNAVSRPVVAIRLYERNWGPARICDTLNEHRAISPPYLRNTCGVKCVTAIKRGNEKWGPGWDVELRELFHDGDDNAATDAIRVQEDECDEPLDIDILELLNGLAKWPENDEHGTGAGIFTKCVQYCAERHLHWRLSSIHRLALALEAGREPTSEEEEG